MIGTQLGTYQVLAKLGEGGMGEVYRARDTRLGRDVALKILPREVTTEPGRFERFNREARTIASLNHPHIVTIYSTEEADGVRFLTMELVEGETLTELITSVGMGLAKFFDISVPLADALTAAHQKQITHRDLKPGNVMVSRDGRVKVLDFGLARVGGSDLAEHSIAATLAPVTQHGMIVGTMPYMSPEQVEGAKLDTRSDLFSLGVIFYELLAGARPFQGTSSPALMSAILRDAPSPLSDRRTDVPDSLACLVSRCLEKRPEDRIQTARDAYNELRHLQKQLDSTSTKRPASASVSDRTAGTPTVSVKPFTARSSDNQALALAEGLTEDITVGLSRFGNLRVVSRGARFALDGSVRTSGSSLRVSVRIADTQSGANVWADNYDGDVAASVFTVQDDIASRIVATVGDPTGVLASAMVAAAADTPLEQQSVAQLVVGYHAYTTHFRAADHARLRAALERALEREPRHAEGWACLALLYQQEHSFNFNPLPDPFEREARAAQRAIQLDAYNQHAWVAIASTHLFARDQHAMRSAVERAVSINLLNADLIAICAIFLSVAGDVERAMELYQRAIHIKPHHPGWYHFAALNAQYMRGEYESALQVAKRMNLPLMPLANLAAIAAAGQVGRASDAAPAIAALRNVAPELLESAVARDAWGRWVWNEGFLDRLVDGLKKSLALVGAGSATPASSTMRSSSDSATASIRSAETLSLAVLPFSVRGADGDADAIATGLTEDITASLGKFAGLSVIALQSARAYKDSPLEARQIAERLNARYILSGSVRKAGSALRVTAHVVDAHTATTVWSETYDRRVVDGDIFTVQDDVTDYIVATVGDQNGVLARTMVELVRQQTPLNRSTAGDLVLRLWGFQHNPTAAAHADLRDAAEAQVQAEPDNPHLWATLAHLYMAEHALWFNPLPDPLERAPRAARRAIEIDRNNQQGWETLAMTCFYLGDRQGLHEASERAIRINPRNAHTVAWMGAMYGHAGEYDRGCALIERAMQINPAHPGWLHFTVFDRHFARGEFTEALAAARRVNMPEFMWMHFAIAAAAGHLGRDAEGRAAYEEMIRRAPPLADERHLREFVTRWYWQPEMIESLLDGVARSRAPSSSTSKHGSRSAVARPTSDSGRIASGTGFDPAFTVTLLPVQSSASGDARSLADGLTQGIAVGLSRFEYLRVITRNAGDDAAATGYSLRGSVREAGGTVRVVMQLSDAQTGTSVWADTYDRNGRGAALFDIQDELTATIVATIADTNGALVRSMAAIVRSKPVETLTPYEAVLRRFTYLSVLSPPEHAAVRDALESAVERAPTYAAGWAVLAQMYVDEYAQDFNARPAPLERARAAADKAIELEAASHPAYLAMALIAYFSRDLGQFRVLAERTLALNPYDTAAMSYIGALTAYSGDWERGLSLCARARSLNPYHPGVYWMVEIVDHYRRGDYEGALAILNRVNMPAYPNSLIVRAALYGRLGRIEEGRALVREAEARSPGINGPDGAARLRWFTQELVDQIQEGLDALRPEQAPTGQD